MLSWIWLHCLPPCHGKPSYHPLVTQVDASLPSHHPCIRGCICNFMRSNDGATSMLSSPVSISSGETDSNVIFEKALVNDLRGLIWSKSGSHGRTRNIMRSHYILVLSCYTASCHLLCNGHISVTREHRLMWRSVVCDAMIC